MNSQIVKAIQEQFAKKRYAFFTRGEFNLNIFSVRSGNSRANKFDDFLFCVYKDENKNWRIHQWPVTTDPGKYWLENPARVEGTAILVPGQYKGVYKIDKHQGRYTALCQRLGRVRVYRDNTKDTVLDRDYNTIQSGMFGINIHHGGTHSTRVDRWSAGCTVFALRTDFNKFMSLVHKAAKIYGNRFTYTLFEE